jgi:uncharacterized repeat protein (TIGR03803 family)
MQDVSWLKAGMKTRTKLRWILAGHGLGILLSMGALSPASAQTNYQKIASYGVGGLTGTNDNSVYGHIYGALIEGDDGRLYGQTPTGGTAGGSIGGAGTVFALNKNGTGPAILHNFISDFSPDDGSYPVGPLLQGSDGFLYGTTPYGGGSCSCGVIFKVNTNGSGYAVIKAFDASVSPLNGFFPEHKLVEGPDGSLYGGTTSGGANGDGVIFKVNKNGSGYTVLRSLSDSANEGVSDLFLSADGMLYGTSGFGGPDESGALFKISTNGTGFSIIRQFTGSGGDGSSPHLIEGSDGKLYGAVTIYSANIGVVFRLDKNGSNYTTLHTFTGTPADGSFPNGLIEAANGALYGTTQTGGSNNLGTIFTIGKDGSNYSVLYHFQASGGGGHYPTAPLVQASDGAFYGNTLFGGDLGVGTIFRLSGAGGAPTIQFSILPSNVLQLSWPASFLGWRLQAQTNAPGVGLTASWSTITNSATTNLWTLPMNPAVGSVFLRLSAP